MQIFSLKKALLLFAAILLFTCSIMAQAPTLGNYPATTVAAASNNIIITPSSVPANATNFFVTTSSNFLGTLSADPGTGKITVTNAQPAGVYILTIRAFNGVASTTSNMTLTVNNAGCSQGYFGSPTTVSSASSSAVLAIGDFNGDGKQDLLNAGSSNSVIVFLGNGTGGLVFNTSVSVASVAGTPKYIVVSDFNGDGKQDMAVQTSGIISIRFGNGLGAFTFGSDVSQTSAPYGLAVADFNNDGKKDLISCGGSTAKVLIGNTNGTFTAGTSLALPNDAQFVAVGDFNNDGNQDIALSNNNSSTVSIRLGDGSGSFTGTTELAIGATPKNIVVTDFNNDGKQDLAVSTVGGVFVGIWLGSGSGNFSSNSQAYVSNNTQSIATGDFNGDGNADLISTNSANNSAYVSLGNGQGGFTATRSVPVDESTSYPYGVVVGDFNNDGKQDFATANYKTSKIAICSPIQAEINIQGNAINIVDGDITPSSSDFTDFGNVDTVFTRTFTVQNTAVGALTISDIKFSGLDSTMFSSNISKLPNILEPSSSITFTISFAPRSAGLKKTTVKIMSDDCDESVYDFAVQGTGIAGPVPTLGTYANTVVATAGRNASVTPSAAPTAATKIIATTIGTFKGTLSANPVTGKITVVNASPAGVYLVTVKAFNGIQTTTTTFNLTVNDPLCSQGLFKTPATFPILQSPYSLAIADMNGDNKQDFVMGLQNAYAITVGLGNGNGGIIGTIDVPIASNTYGLAITDFNGDGNMDIVACLYFKDVAVVRFGDGTGNFTGTTTVPVGIYPVSVVTGDFNADGRPDFATSNDHTISIRLGNGYGGFDISSDIYTPNTPDHLAIGDFNGDGKQDIASSTLTGYTIAIQLGDGNGNFAAAPDVPVAFRSEAVVVADFDMDGKQDLACSHRQTNGTISILKGDGQGGFVVKDTLPIGANADFMVGGDFNGDGKPDLVVAYFGSPLVTVELGNGIGGFTRKDITVGGSQLGLTVGDFNGDGKQDLATTSYSSLYILLSGDAEINVQGNSTDIANGSSSPSLLNHTNFGNVSVGDSLVRTFTIQNQGTVALSISQIKIVGLDSASFSKSAITLPATITAGASASFNVVFKANSTGNKNAMVQVLSDDCDEASYSFAVQGVSVSVGVWLGNSADWNSPSNWSNGMVPTAFTQVVVNSGVPFMPIVTDPNSICYSLTLHNGSTITVTAQGHLTIVH